jgi:formylglycine-generating enzyme required for sulfatase activity
MAEAASKLVSGLDPRWDKFIATSLAEDPGKRYQTAALALAGLQQLRHSDGSKKGLWTAVIAVIVAAGVGIAVWQSRGTPAAAQKVDPANVAAANQVTAGGKSPQEPAKQLPEAPANRKFALTSLPAGAVVYYHGNHPAGTAGRVVLDLPPGPQSVRVMAPGYIDWEGEVGGVENEKEGTVPLEQVPSHPVRFTGLPAQAQLKVDGVMVAADASGAAVVALRPGRVTLSVSAAKYEPLEQAVDIAQATESVPLQMKRLPPPAEVLVKLPKGVDLKFKWVAAGSFYAGSPTDERGRQSTDLARTKKDVTKGFYIAETETTQKQHRALTGKNPSTSRALGDESRPVEQVAWRDLVGTGGVLDKTNEALRHLELPYKADLPTEVEWEYACRAGSDTAFNDGSQLTNERDEPALNALGFYSRGGSPDAPSPVAKFKPNAWGIYDMHGNVAEWAYGVRGARDPVVRGGNWKVGPVHCRSASRVELTPETRSTDTMGYRLVLRPTEE